MKALIGLLLIAFLAPITVRGQAPAANEKLGFGLDELPIPAPEERNDTSPRTVQLLGQAMRRSQGADRVRFVRDIGECRLSDGLPHLQEAMADTDPLVRAEAARSIGRINDPAALPALRTLLGDSAAIVRAAAITAGAQLGDPAFVDKGLQDADVDVQREAIDAATPQHADAIARRLADLPGNAMKLRALAALSRIGASAANGQAIASQIGDQPALTAAAIRALGRTKSTAQSSIVLKALKHAHPTVRREAILALPGLVDAQTQQQRAIEMLEDADLSIRQAAATVLQSAPTAQAVGGLVEQLAHEEYQPLHDAAREALVAAGPDAVPAAEQLLADTSPRRREDGSYILGKLRSDAGFDRHVKLLEDTEWQVVEQAARSLGQIGRADAADELAALAAKATRMNEVLAAPSDSQVGGAHADAAITQAILAAARLGHRPVLDPLLRIIPARDQFSASHRAAAIWAYGMLAETPDPKILGRFPALYNNMEESADVKLEILKAYGNLAYKPAQGFLEGVLAQPEDWVACWIANWGLNRITGENKTFTPAPIARQADVSISDIPAR